MNSLAAVTPTYGMFDAAGDDLVDALNLLDVPFLAGGLPDGQPGAIPPDLLLSRLAASPSTPAAGIDTIAAALYLLGGSALCLLGNSRPTLDIDYVGDDLRKDELQRTIDEVASEMRLEVDDVPISGFIPISNTAYERSLYVGQFNHLHVYVFDPYAIALSKVDRGFDTDVEDILFPIKRGDISLQELAGLVYAALEQAAKFGLDAKAMLSHLQAVRSEL